jgi:glycine oxidase
MRIVIHGAGIFGLSVAWACAGRGAQVTVVDPRGPGAGASGGVVGALAPHVPEAWNTKKALQFESLEMAGRFWTEVASVSGLDPGYARAGRVQPLPDADAVDRARARAITAADLWQGRYVWQVRTPSATATSSTAPRAMSFSTTSPQGCIRGARSRPLSRRWPNAVCGSPSDPSMATRSFMQQVWPDCSS